LAHEGSMYYLLVTKIWLSEATVLWSIISKPQFLSGELRMLTDNVQITVWVLFHRRMQKHKKIAYKQYTHNT